MSLTYNKKVPVCFTREEECMLDGQSKICNWLYNQLLAACQKDYKENNNELQLLEGRNLRNYGVSLKGKHLFLNTVFSSVLKDPAERLLKAFTSFFKGNTGYPHFRSWKKKWYSLIYDEPNKGWELQRDGTKLSISLGDIPGLPKEKGKRNPSIIGKLGETVVLKEGEVFKTLRICKQQGNKFYAIFTVEHCSQEELACKEVMSAYRKECNLAKKEKRKKPEKPKLEEKQMEIPKDISWIALDPNHKNFFVGVDHEGNSIEFTKLQMIKYWDTTIDTLKSLRDVCEKNYKKRKTEHGSSYTIHSSRWNRVNKALNIAYHKRREQIKTALYSIAHELYRRYDLVIIGDYTPTNGTARFDNMKRSMLNQEKIGEFRRILEWVAAKLQKHYIMVNERNTTKECCVCGHMKKKDPDVRNFTCEKCETILKRDTNSAVNIGKKADYFLDINAHKHKLNHFSFTGYAVFGRKISWISNHL